mmetsp:Transcript_85266/g.275190  ORF Transcript_85266/g.275190 Transcript_85266/m.275190 type:complete len:219 (+) Transcript_85266:671-1327(+)
MPAAASRCGPRGSRSSSAACPPAPEAGRQTARPGAWHLSLSWLVCLRLQPSGCQHWSFAVFASCKAQANSLVRRPAMPRNSPRRPATSAPARLRSGVGKRRAPRRGERRGPRGRRKPAAPPQPQRPPQAGLPSPLTAAAPSVAPQTRQGAPVPTAHRRWPSATRMASSAGPTSGGPPKSLLQVAAAKVHRSRRRGPDCPQTAAKPSPDQSSASPRTKH